MNTKIKKRIIALGIIGTIALGGASLSADKNNVGKAELTSKFNASQEVKSKYVLNDAELVKTDIKNAELDKYKREPKDEIKVTIGNNSQVKLGGLFGAGEKEFKPDIELKRWNEVSFKLKTDKLLADKKNKAVSFEKDKVKFASDKMSFEMYAPDAENYKYIWYLNEKPTTNKIEFTIESAGLDFFYQPPLNVENTDPNLTCTETQCKDKDGNIVMERPENVVGSYAVYHSTKGGMNDINGKDYKVGKAFHIFRPHIIDANGAETWGILHIENGIYSVEIPQEFLDKAVYPIKSNDTIGYTSIGATESNTSNYQQATARGQATSNGTLSSIKMALRDAGGNSYAKLALYNESSSLPVSLVANSYTNQILVTRTTKPTQDSEWTSGNSSASVVSGNYYWLGFSLQDISVFYSYDTSGGTRGYYLTGSYAGFPADPFGSSPTATSLIRSIYATYTPSGGGAAPVRESVWDDE